VVVVAVAIDLAPRPLAATCRLSTSLLCVVEKEDEGEEEEYEPGKNFSATKTSHLD
jgi:hypothetical protein